MVVEAAVKKGTKKTTLWSEWGSTLKKCLTEPTLLEMRRISAGYLDQHDKARLAFHQGRDVTVP